MELPCFVEYVTFKKDSFRILACSLDVYSNKYTREMEDLVKDCINEKYNTFTVTVGMFDINEDPKGGQYVFVGEFITEKRFGRQFKANFYYQDQPSTVEGLKSFLMSLPNIKESRSEAIIQKFGLEETINIFDNNANRLLEISGINEKRLIPIKKAWDEKKYLRDLYSWLVSKSISVGIADKAYKLWGKEALKTIQTNPYKLTELKGIGFITADKIAHQVLTDVPKDIRITSCIKHILVESTYSDSNLCIPYAVLKKKVLALLLECDQALGKKELDETYLLIITPCIKANLHIFTAVKDTQEDKIYIYLREVWNKEKFIASAIYERKEFNHAAKRECTDKDVDRAEKDASVFNNREIRLDDSQKDAIKSAFGHKITVITGPGGSGKSTICRCIFTIAQDFGMTIRMMSPTGKAAQVLEKKTGCGATTIHRGLKMTPKDEKPREDIIEDILLIDEISMCGLDTMNAIMQALDINKWCNIILVGDKNQLASVSPGNFLLDIIESGCANVVTLDKIHRQSDGSYISLLANEISKGKVVTIPEKATDIKWHSLNVDTFQEKLLEFIDNYLANGNSMDDLQIISPMKKGQCGVFKINDIIQEKMAIINNAKDNVLAIGFNKFYVGDRVIQMENNYEKNIFNGEIGTIVELGEKVVDPTINDKKERFVAVKFYDEVIEYYSSDIEQLSVAFCVTIHKYQGSQSKNIVMILAEEANIMASKEILYTGMSRAEKQLDIFGHESMLRIAPTRSTIRKRYTNFKKIIEDIKSGKKILDVLEKTAN